MTAFLLFLLASNGYYRDTPSLVRDHLSIGEYTWKYSAGNNYDYEQN